ncbi:hypothetical protein ACFLSE_10830, partial [Bacteroidota bacterium]
LLIIGNTIFIKNRTKAFLRNEMKQICFSKTQMQLKAAKSGRAKNVFHHTFRTNLYKIPIKLVKIQIP